MVRDDAQIPAAQTLLTGLGIEAYEQKGILTINRTSMVSVMDADEQVSYDTTLALLKEAFPTHRVMWSFRDDEVMCVDFYLRG